MRALIAVVVLLGAAWPSPPVAAQQAETKVADKGSQHALELSRLDPEMEVAVEKAMMVALEEYLGDTTSP